MKNKCKKKLILPMILAPVLIAPIATISAKTNSKSTLFLKDKAKISNMKIWKMEKDSDGNLLMNPYYGVILFKGSSNKVNDKLVLSKFNISKRAKVNWDKVFDASKEGIYKCSITNNGKKYEIRIYVTGDDLKYLKFNNLQLPPAFNFPEGVKQIITNGEEAPFKESILNNDFVIPKSTSVIGKYAFSEIKKLPKGFKLPDKIKNIPEGLFYKTSLNDDFAIPKSVTSIGKYAFSGIKNSGIKKLPKGFKLPNNLKTIDYAVFWNRDLNDDFAIPKSVTNIEDYAFSRSILNDSFALPQNLKSIGDYAFSGSTLNDNFFIPKSTTNIGNYSFSEIKKLPKGFKLPDKIKNIPEGLFYKTSLNDDFAIPKSVTSIGKYAFSGIKNSGIKKLPKGFKLPSNVKTIDYAVFWNRDLNDDFAIPKSLTSIEDYAFSGSILNDSFALPQNLKSIGDYAFSGIKKLPKGFKLPDKIKNIPEGVFYKTTLNDDFVLPQAITSVDSYAFSRIKKLPKGFKLPDNIKYIPEGAFMKTTLNDDFIIPKSVTSIHSYSFSGSALNNNFFIPNSVTSIHKNAFTKTRYTKEFFKKAKQNAKKLVKSMSYLKYDESKIVANVKISVIKDIENAKNYNELISIAANNKIGSGVEKINNEISNYRNGLLKNLNDKKLLNDFLDKVLYNQSKLISELNTQKEDEVKEYKEKIKDLNLKNQPISSALKEDVLETDLNRIQKDIESLKAKQNQDIQKLKYKTNELHKVKSYLKIAEQKLKDSKIKFFKTVPGVLVIAFLSFASLAFFWFIIKIINKNKKTK